MIYSILLTRLAEQNMAFQATLIDAGVDVFEKVVSKPLLTIKSNKIGSIARQYIADFDLYDITIFISKNAVQYGLPQLEAYWAQWPASMIWLAVGPATASLLEDEDFQISSPKVASSEGLLAMPELSDVAGQKILIVRGIGGRETLKQGLIKRGASIDYLEVYERKPVAQDFDSSTHSELVQFTPIYSGEVLAHFRSLIGDNTSQYQLILPSQRLQSMAIDLGFDKVILAESQEDKDMMAALRNGIVNLS